MRVEMTMNAISFRPVARERGGVVSETERPLEAAWIVLEAANDLGDAATVEVCRRVIDANLNGTPADSSDLHIVLDYFR
jgi:hypothetical protein